MKKIISVIVLGVVSLVGIVALVDSSNTETAQTSAPQQELDKVVSENQKKELKQKTEDALKGYNVTDVSVTADRETEKPIVNIQITTDNLKEECEKADIEVLYNEIQDKVKSISEFYDVEFIDKKYQLVASSYYIDKKLEFK